MYFKYSLLSRIFAFSNVPDNKLYLTYGKLKSIEQLCHVKSIDVNLTNGVEY